VKLLDLATPALLIDRDALGQNLDFMAASLPGDRLRPHVKAHKSTALAREQAARGHCSFTCATAREMAGMAAAGLGDDLLLANELLDTARLSMLADLDARVTVAVDSASTVSAAAAAGIAEVLIDVNVGLPRCGCLPADAGRLADSARAAGLQVRGVMGYEGHAVGLEDREQRRVATEVSMQLLAAAHADVGGELVSAGGTTTWDLNKLATEIQAGSYALMDTAYTRMGLPFTQAVSILSTVVSVSEASGYAVADCGLKALGMDHGDPSIEEARVWFCSDEHVTFSPDPASPDAAAGSRLPVVGDRVRVLPAHVDPTMACHERAYLVSGDEVVDCWAIDLRSW